jgi:D-aminopeptidase
VRRPRGGEDPVVTPSLTNEAMSPLFAAAAEATEEAIYNAILKATTVESSRGKLEAIPLDEVKRILEKYRVLNWDRNLSPRR